MDSRLERKLQYAAAWCGPVFLVGYLISFGLLGHNHPPPSPAYTPQELEPIRARVEVTPEVS